MRGCSASIDRALLKYAMGISLISPDELLRQSLSTAGAPIIIDARPIDEYRLGHIPGAISVDWTDWCEATPLSAGSSLHRPGYWGSLADRPTEWYASRLAEMGLSSEAPIVVYADGQYSKGRDGRIAWMLLYLGARSVSLLNGGWRAWQRAGGAAAYMPAPPERGAFLIDIQEHRRCSRLDLMAGNCENLHQVLVDTRSAAEFEGRLHAYQPRMGHVPAAVLLPFLDLFLPTGMYLDAMTYQTRIPSQVLQASRLVAYCEVGVRACCFALLHEIHTGQVVRVYDGSIIEWSLDPGMPVLAGV